MASAAAKHLFPNLKDIFLRTKVKDFLFDGILIDCSSDEAQIICGPLEGTAPESFRKHENNRDFLFSMFHHVSIIKYNVIVFYYLIHHTTVFLLCFS